MALHKKGVKMTVRDFDRDWMCCFVVFGEAVPFAGKHRLVLRAESRALIENLPFVRVGVQALACKSQPEG